MNEFEITIRSAYIQGILGVLGALIGAAVVIFSLRSTAKNTVKQIKIDKIAESKRDQYIDLTDTYTQFLVSSLLLKHKKQDSDNHQPDIEWDTHLSKYIRLIGCINKVNLITTSSIRLELYELEKVLITYQTPVSNHFFNNFPLDSSKTLEQKVFDFAKLLRNDLSIESHQSLEAKLSQLRLKHKL
ncbi:hypothetical protein [Acinetobacter sp. YH16032]|uniref:hypothetical protein n=1 Tax=Acinetobacter sp. YH16032 TaxID=2601181 RepID=UPI0015D46799|nr:hypothetical protein [Acinetobacter sp. YH16032]